MPPTLHLVRHAQGYHNLDPHNEDTLFNPPLTKRGRDQCQRLAATFPYHADIDFVISSPLRRTIETTLLGFSPLLTKRKLKILLEPRCQETTAKPSDTGVRAQQILEDFGPDVVDVSRVVDGWNTDQGEWEMNEENLELHCKELHQFLASLPHSNLLLVAHGSFLESFTGQDGWYNTEFRSYHITTEGLDETAVSQKTRRNDGPQGGFREDLGAPHENPFGLL